MAKHYFGTLSDNLKNQIKQSLLLFYTLNQYNNPERSVERRVESLKPRTIRKWHDYCYWRMHDAEKLKQKYLNKINEPAPLRKRG